VTYHCNIGNIVKPKAVVGGCALIVVLQYLMPCSNGLVTSVSTRHC